MVLPRTPTSDKVNVVRAHRLDTTAYLVATQPNCLAIRRIEGEKVTGRRLRLASPDGLPPPDRLPSSWVVAVLLCPGDTTDALAAWTRALPLVLRHRIWFYEAPSLDPAVAYRAWHDAGLGKPLADPFRDFYDFNRLFANDLNEQIYQDHKPASSPNL